MTQTHFRRQESFGFVYTLVGMSEMDDKIDALHLSVFDKVLGETWKGAAVDTVDATLASRYHERFADHAVSIAKKVQYLATGDWVTPSS